MVDTKRIRDALSGCISFNCRWGGILDILDKELSIIESKYPVKPKGSTLVAGAIDKTKQNALEFLDRIGARPQTKTQALAFFEKIKLTGTSIGHVADIALNEARSEEYNQIYNLLPPNIDQQINLFENPALNPIFIPLKAWLDHRFMAVEPKPPRTITWNGHRVEVHTITSGNDLNEVTLVNVETMHSDPNGWQLSSYLYVADGESSIDDPVSRYNCFSLALHTNWRGLIPLDDRGCVAREKIAITSMAGGIPRDVTYCKYDPQYWSMPYLEDSCNASPRAIRLCNDPADHIMFDGYRFVDVRFEEIMPGDRLIYLNEFPLGYLFGKVLPDKQKRHTYLKHRLPGFPYMQISHAAVVLEVRDSDIMVLEKLDMGPAIVSSAFDNFVEYGQHFAVIRKLPGVMNNEKTADLIRQKAVTLRDKKSSNECEKKYPNETDTLPKDCQVDKFIKGRAKRKKWSEIRQRNCEKNVAKCPGFLMK